MLRSLGLLLILADVVILKNGGKVPGKITDKTDHYDVTTEGVLRTYLKDEVERVVTSPKEFLGDADKLIDEARADYQKALGLTNSADQNIVLKAAIAKVGHARDAYGVAMELFPDDGALGKQIMIVMQLMRLLRERVHLDETRLPGSPPSINRPSSAPALIEPNDALATLLDAAKRSDPARRASALISFKSQQSDFATAAAMYLSQPEPAGTAQKAVQDYFDKPWLRQTLSPAGHLEAAKAIASQTSGREALQPFALIHLVGAAQEADVEKVARSLSLLVQNGIVGTPEGHAVRDLDNWLAHGEYDLAVMAFINEYRAIDTPAVRYVWSYALLRLVQARKRGFERPVSAFETVKISATGGPEHLAALGKSIKAVAVCNVCAGVGRFRCTNCHGKKETKFLCQRCKGSGHTISSLGAQLVCPPCRGTGIDRIVKCEKCKDGYVDCKQCDKPRPAPTMEDMVTTAPCTACEGRGMAFRSAAVPCRSCLGLGARLVPRADPTKQLP